MKDNLRGELWPQGHLGTFPSSAHLVWHEFHFFCASGKRYLGVQEVQFNGSFLLLLEFLHCHHSSHISAIRLSLDSWSSLQDILQLLNLPDNPV